MTWYWKGPYGWNSCFYRMQILDNQSLYHWLCKSLLVDFSWWLLLYACYGSNNSGQQIHSGPYLSFFLHIRSLQIYKFAGRCLHSSFTDHIGIKKLIFVFFKSLSCVPIITCHILILSWSFLVYISDLLSTWWWRWWHLQRVSRCREVCKWLGHWIFKWNQQGVWNWWQWLFSAVFVDQQWDSWSR